MCETYPPHMHLARLSHLGGRRGGTAAHSPGLLSVREEALLEVVHFECFIDDLCDLLICISLAKLCDATSSAEDVCCVNIVTE